MTHGVGVPLGTELVDVELARLVLVDSLGGSELAGGAEEGGRSGSSGLSPSDEELAVTAAPAPTATGAAAEPATVKKPPPGPPTTTTPTATTMVSPLLTVVVTGAVLVGAADETGRLVVIGGFVGAEEGTRDVVAPEGGIVEGGRDGRLDEGITRPVDVPLVKGVARRRR